MISHLVDMDLKQLWLVDSGDKQSLVVEAVDNMAVVAVETSVVVALVAVDNTVVVALVEALVVAVDNTVVVALVEVEVVVDNIVAAALAVAWVVVVDNTAAVALGPAEAPVEGNTAAVAVALAAESIVALAHNLLDSVVVAEAVACLVQPRSLLDTLSSIPLSPFYFVLFKIIVKFETFFV